MNALTYTVFSKSSSLFVPVVVVEAIYALSGVHEVADRTEQSHTITFGELVLDVKDKITRKTFDIAP